jgi:hypothetical protein
MREIFPQRRKEDLLSELHVKGSSLRLCGKFIQLPSGRYYLVLDTLARWHCTANRDKDSPTFAPLNSTLLYIQDADRPPRTSAPLRLRFDKPRP